ncbi:hypothetical protein ACR6C2_08295 [Streptomyces sp. INA 01156]
MIERLVLGAFAVAGACIVMTGVLGVAWRYLAPTGDGSSSR